MNEPVEKPAAALSFFSEGGKSHEKKEIQLPLLEVEAARAELVKRGHYDAQTLRAMEPGKYAAIVELLGKGFARNLIKDVVGVAYETVVAVALAQSADIREGKRRMVAELDIILAFSSDKLREKAMNEGLSPLEHAILIDKRELLNGGVTQRIGHVTEDEDPEVAAFRQLASQGKAIEMVPGDGNVWQEAGAPGLGAGEGPIIELIDQKPQTGDSQSTEQNAQPVEHQ
jgi:hypothetical protein